MIQKVTIIQQIKNMMIDAIYNMINTGSQSNSSSSSIQSPQQPSLGIIHSYHFSSHPNRHDKLDESDSLEGSQKQMSNRNAEIIKKLDVSLSDNSDDGIMDELMEQLSQLVVIVNVKKSQHQARSQVYQKLIMNEVDKLEQQISALQKQSQYTDQAISNAQEICNPDIHNEENKQLPSFFNVECAGKQAFNSLIQQPFQYCHSAWKQLIAEITQYKKRLIHMTQNHHQQLNYLSSSSHTFITQVDDQLEQIKHSKQVTFAQVEKEIDQLWVQLMGDIVQEERQGRQQRQKILMQVQKCIQILNTYSTT